MFCVLTADQRKFFNELKLNVFNCAFGVVVVSRVIIFFSKTNLPYTLVNTCCLRKNF